LFVDGNETAVAVMFVADADDDASINEKFSLSLSGGTLTFVDVGSID
jgi:hypothetical protein